MDVSGFTFHLACDKIPMPRIGDRIVSKMFMDYTSNRETLESLQRMRGAMKVFFLSDMVTADGKFLEHGMTDPNNWEGTQSKYDFPLECPTKEDELD